MGWPILISALIAGLAAITVTVVIEKWGGLHGGALATVPSTIIPAAIGIWYGSESVETFQSAMYIVPLGLVVNGLFLYMWRILPSRIPHHPLTLRLTMISTLSLIVWAAAAAAGIELFIRLIAIGVPSLTLAVAWLCTGLIFGLLSTRTHRPTPRGKRKVSTLTLVARGLAAAISIGAAVWLAGIGIPLLSGIMTIFPAIFLTSMVALWLAQGEAVPAGAIGPMIFGAQSVSLFAILVASLYPHTSTIVGLSVTTMAAWVVSVGAVNLPVWYYLRSRSEGVELV